MGGLGSRITLQLLYALILLLLQLLLMFLPLCISPPPPVHFYAPQHEGSTALPLEVAPAAVLCCCCCCFRISSKPSDCSRHAHMLKGLCELINHTAAAAAAAHIHTTAAALGCISQHQLLPQPLQHLLALRVEGLRNTRLLVL